MRLAYSYAYLLTDPSSANEPRCQAFHFEKLDFRRKKAALEGESRKYSRMLSSFSYGKIKAYSISRGYPGLCTFGLCRRGRR